MSSLNLYNYFRSSTSYRVRIALEFKNLSYNYTAVHLLNNGGEQNSDTYLKLNPTGGVPTLIHGEKVISQSFAIIEYLEEVFPKSPLLFSGDSFQRAKIRQVCETVNADIHPLSNLKVMQHLESKYAFTPLQKQEWISKWVTEGLRALENLLEPYAGDFSFGDKVTAADAFLIPQLFSAQRFQVDFSGFKNLSRINDNCAKRSEFAKAHPHRQPDTPAELRLPDFA